MSLSDKRKDSYTAEDLKEGLYRGKDVKEFIRELKEEIENPSFPYANIFQLIDKLAGKELTEEKKENE